jgi:hypothetical protein
VSRSRAVCSAGGGLTVAALLFAALAEPVAAQQHTVVVPVPARPASVPLAEVPAGTAAAAPGAAGLTGESTAAARGWPGRLGLSGYLRTLTGIHDAGFDLPQVERRSGFHGQVARLRWQLSLGDRFAVSMHNRLQAQVSSAAATFGDAAGFGVTVVPARPVDLSTRLIEQERLELWHDIDRLALTIRGARSDLTLGRQAITWGLAYVFPVADVWASFSPFELDTEEKPGIDAVRLLSYPAAGLELDAVLAARARAEDWSAGLRATWELASADVYAGAGKFWDQLMALGGVAYMRDRAVLRGEGVVVRNIDGGSFQRPRATLGVDWLSGRLRLTGEYHHNGVGVTDPGRYVGQFGDPRVVRGETYLLGRDYLGGALSWSANDDGRLSLAVSSLWNLNDRSLAATPVASYDFGRSANVSVGVLRTFGRTPRVSPAPAPRSEFGTSGQLWFSRISVFF